MKNTFALLIALVLAFGTLLSPNQASASVPSAFFQNKKDGTPDKRFKANKTPKKKDGTPDKRFKANKTPKPKKQ